ncbi:arylsulfatase [Akkermansiaceae bacterium]|nr:arylsulfatase [Akkermansiaceae bacterium]
MKTLLPFLLAATLTAYSAEKPNIIVIMADDLGYGDVSCYGAKVFQTPHIDKLASEGQRFTSGYCSASTCTPTRYSMLTGTYAFRTKGTGIAPPNGPAIIKPGTTTLPSLLKEVGYETAVIGKWHLGLGDPKPDWNGKLAPGPLEIGFNHCFLLPTTNDRVPQVFVKDHHVLNLDPKDPLWVGDKLPSPDHKTGMSHRDDLKMDWTHGHNGTIHNGISRIGFYTGGHAARFRDEDLADKWVEQSNAFMEANKDKPFFLFFASHDNHVPRMPHERFQGKSGTGLRGDAILELDWCVGEIVKTLGRLGLTENTLVVFCSDNGPVLDDGYKDGSVTQLGDHEPAGPYTGGKYTVFEGGTRTPFITSWPGKIPAGTSDKIVCTIDLAASFSSLTGATIPDDACLDSIDVLSALLGKNDGTGRDELVQQDNGNKGAKNDYGLRSGDWKLIRRTNPYKQPAVISKKPIPAPGPLHTLYFLPDDPAEKRDVSKENPEMLKQLIERLDAIIAAGRTRS